MGLLGIRKIILNKLRERKKNMDIGEVETTLYLKLEMQFPILQVEMMK